MPTLALVLAAALAAPAAGPARIQNDWAAALAEARARKLPIFVDAWAPW
jgi:endonuclease YncB( thermonuclease family)